MSIRRINYGESVPDIEIFKVFCIYKADRLGSVFFESTALLLYSLSL